MQSPRPGLTDPTPQINGNVSVLQNGKVVFDNGLTALTSSAEGVLKLSRVETTVETVTIEISDANRIDTTRYEIRGKDGKDAPDWVQIDPSTGELIIRAQGNSGTLDLMLVAIDGNNQRSMEIEIDLDELIKNRDTSEEVREVPSENRTGERNQNDNIPAGAFVSLEEQIDHALTSKDYGYDLQTALRFRV